MSGMRVLRCLGCVSLGHWNSLDMLSPFVVLVAWEKCFIFCSKSLFSSSGCVVVGVHVVLVGYRTCVRGLLDDDFST